MRRSALLLFILLFGIGFGQKSKSSDIHLTFYGGLGLTNFENQATMGGGMIAGISMGFIIFDQAELGFEINSTVSPFTLQTDIDGYTYEENISQTIFGIYGQYYFLNKRNTKGFARFGGGFYTGDWEQIYAETEKVSLEGTLGYHLGIGFVFDEGFMLETLYHFVNRKPTTTNSESFRADNFQFLVGYIFSF